MEIPFKFSNAAIDVLNVDCCSITDAKSYYVITDLNDSAVTEPSFSMNLSNEDHFKI